MKKILIILFLLISSLSYSQINKLKIGNSNLTDSSGFLRIKSNSTIEFLNYTKFDENIEVVGDATLNSLGVTGNTILGGELLVGNNVNVSGDVDITGDYLINGVPLSTGGGDVFKNLSNNFTTSNTFDDSIIVRYVDGDTIDANLLKLNNGILTDLNFKQASNNWIKTEHNHSLFLGVNSDTSIQIETDNDVRLYEDLTVDGRIDADILNVVSTTALVDLTVNGNYDLSSGYSIGDILFVKGSDTYFGTADDNDLIFQRNGSDAMRFNVGEVAIDGDLSVTGKITGDGTGLSGVAFTDASNAFTESNTFSAQRNTFKSINLVAGADDTIGTGDNYALYFKVNNSPKIKIASNGILNYYSNTSNYTIGSNVVIGTTDDYAYSIKTSDTSRFSISNRGVVSVNSKNLVLGGNFTTSGNFATTLYATGTTTDTLPTSGTFATIYGSENLRNKTLTTPDLGVATATSINKVTITAPSTSSTLTIANGKTLTASNTLTFAGTDGTTMTFPSSSSTVVGLENSNTFTGTTNTFKDISALGYYSTPYPIKSSNTIPWDSSGIFTDTLTANTTYTFSSTTVGKTIEVNVVNNATSYTVSWPSGILWQGGSAPVQTTSASGIRMDTYFFVKLNSSQYRGSYSQNFY